MTCTECGETEGEPLGHDWTEATCTMPKYCERCNETVGEALGHDWVEASCDSPKTCSRCGKTEGIALDHEWAEATCEHPKTCVNCGLTEGEALPIGYYESIIITNRSEGKYGKSITLNNKYAQDLYGDYWYLFEKSIIFQLPEGRYLVELVDNPNLPTIQLDRVIGINHDIYDPLINDTLNEWIYSNEENYVLSNWYNNNYENNAIITIRSGSYIKLDSYEFGDLIPEIKLIFTPLEEVDYEPKEINFD